MSLPRVLYALLCLPWLILLGWMSALSWWLVDDAFISFRYARNLLDGHGLVFNPGERVEGYTNFLWTLELAGIWGLFGVRPEHSAPWLSVAFTAGTLASVLYQVARMPYLRHRGLIGWMSLGLVCCSATFAVWTSASGLETRQFTFFVAAAVALLAVHRGSRVGLLSASVSLGLASLTRPEGVLIAGCCVGWFVLQSMAGVSVCEIRGTEGGRAARVSAVIVRVLKRIDWRAVACLVLPFALTAGAHFLFRWLYYGELLPNTYHAKFVRPWWDMGLRYYAAAGLETGLYLLVPLAAAGAWLRWKSHRDGIYALVLLCIALHALHVTRIGGDIFEWRPLDFYWPLLVVPAAEVIALLGAKLASGVKGIAPALRRFLSLAPVVFALFVFALVLFYSSAMQFALLRTTHETERWAGTFIRLDHRDAALLFAAPGMSWLYQVNEGLRMEMYEHAINLRFIRRPEFLSRLIEGWLAPYEDALRGKVPKDAVTVQGSLGRSGYSLTEMTVIDYHGLTDKTVARNPDVPPNDERRMGHDRAPPYGYLDQRGVNMRIRPPALSEEGALAAAGYALQLGEELWMPFYAIDHQWVQDSFGGPELSSASDGVSAIDVMSDLVGDRDPEIRSGFYDVHIIGDSVVYVKSPCIWDDVDHHLYLYLVPADGSYLSARGRMYGFDQLNLNFWRINVAADPNACVARVDLPGYETASVKAGQLADNGAVLWEGSYSMHTTGAVKDLRQLRLQGDEPEVSYDFDVFVDGGRLIYHKRPCSSDEIDARFVLHVHPNDVDDLPPDRIESGFDNLDFSLWQKGGRVGDECVARVDLPEYEIASIATGQLADDGHKAWDTAFSFALPEILDDLVRLQKQSRQPEIASLFDVFLYGNRLIYRKEWCSRQDIDARFFLHVHPADAMDLPLERRESGFDNLDFSLSDRGGRVGDGCGASVDLPDYEIASIATGQFTQEGSIWEGSFEIDDAYDMQDR